MSTPIRPGEATRTTLVTALETAGALARSESIDGVALGKSLAAIVSAVRAVYGEAGVSSMRLAAAEKALDLRTKKSALEAFVTT